MRAPHDRGSETLAPGNSPRPAHDPGHLRPKRPESESDGLRFHARKPRRFVYNVRMSKPVGRPKRVENGVTISAKVDETTKRQIQAIAGETGDTISVVVDEILTGYLDARTRFGGPRAQAALVRMVSALTGGATADELEEFAPRIHGQ